MTTDRTDPDQGPIASAFLAACAASLAAIGAAALTAIGSAMTFELAPIPGGAYEQLLFIGAASRWSGEVAGLLVLAVAYRRCRGFPAMPGRPTVLGLMKATAAVGLVAARFVEHLGPWVGR